MYQYKQTPMKYHQYWQGNEVEAALREMKNGKEARKDQVNVDSLKAGDETITKQLYIFLVQNIGSKNERHTVIFVVNMISKS